MNKVYKFTIQCDNGPRVIFAESEDDAYGIAVLSGWIQ